MKRLCKAELIAFRILHHDVIVVPILVGGNLLGAERDQPGRFCSDLLLSLIQWSSRVGAGSEIEVEPVLSELGFGNSLEPDAGAAVFRIPDLVIRPGPRVAFLLGHTCGFEPLIPRRERFGRIPRTRNEAPPPKNRRAQKD